MNLLDILVKRVSGNLPFFRQTSTSKPTLVRIFVNVFSLLNLKVKVMPREKDQCRFIFCVFVFEGCCSVEYLQDGNRPRPRGVVVSLTVQSGALQKRMSLRRHFVRENLRLPYKEDGTVTKSVFFHGILKRYGDPQTRGYSGLQKIRFQSDGYPWWFLFTSFERSYGRFLSQMFPRFQYHVLRVFKFKY